MVLRERPFPVFREYQEGGYSAWDNLPRVVISRDRVLSGMSLQQQGSERITALNLQAQTNPVKPFAFTAVNPPVINRVAVRKYGLRLYDPTTNFLSLPEDNGQLAPDEMSRWKWLLASWFGANHEFRSGSVPIKGFDPALRIGRAFTVGSGPYPDADANKLTAYIEGVNLSWSPPPGGWMTGLRVTRGLRGDYQLVLAQHLGDFWGGLETIGAEGLPSLLFPGALRVPPDRLACYAVGKSDVRAGMQVSAQAGAIA
jgi:hypothetical protein